jgi:hypothetical protein
MYSKELLKQINKTYNPEGKELIFEFFLLFSRFEYSLKECGYHSGNSKRIGPNWTAFASSIKNNFDQNSYEKLNISVEKLINNPPKKQVLLYGIAAFVDRENLEKMHIVDKLKLHICDIRNNLFHGGKFDGDYEPEVSRNHILLKSAIEVLNYWLTLDERVRNSFSLPIAN